MRVNGNIPSMHSCSQIYCFLLLIGKKSSAWGWQRWVQSLMSLLRIRWGTLGCFHMAACPIQICHRRSTPTPQITVQIVRPSRVMRYEIITNSHFHTFRATCLWDELSTLTPCGNQTLHNFSEAKRFYPWSQEKQPNFDSTYRPRNSATNFNETLTLTRTCSRRHLFSCHCLCTARLHLAKDFICKTSFNFYTFIVNSLLSFCVTYTLTSHHLSGFSQTFLLSDRKGPSLHVSVKRVV